MPTTTHKNTLGLTLAAFSADVDDHLHRPAGFARAVRALADARAVIKAVKDRRELLYREMEVRQGAAAATVINLGSGERKAVVRRAARVTVTRTVPSEVVKKLDKAAYEAAKRPEARLTLTVPANYRLSAAVPKLPPVPAPYMDMAMLVGLYKSPAFDVLGELRIEEADARADLDKIAADAGWDGGVAEGPLVFADGWAVRLRQMRYSADVLKRNDPQLYERLAVVKQTRHRAPLEVLDFDMAANLGLIDLESLDSDEIDGD